MKPLRHAAEFATATRVEDATKTRLVRRWEKVNGRLECRYVATEEAAK